ncbi:hypothetical protein FRB94_011140 [Tulasnella sp. JGI-2019a]|nr:hypothetical protein FRB93_000479 [Tulasnella sp. JGI-2019a]KAG9010004.1 hypothetical protein FRB94_011140 [Tulasnella sp. JGI-2019a]KAG9029547.1 hypothetical protein FRB95_005221 [Tulasnella sp. JGI-2019a]
MDATLHPESSQSDLLATPDSNKIDLAKEEVVLRRKAYPLAIDDIDSSDDRKEGSSGRIQLQRPLSSHIPTTPAVGVPLRRDERYCFDDGNVILLVYDTFFKVHRSRLCVDDSVFTTLFCLPQEVGSAAEGVSWHRPIRLPEKPRRFANLLWALYALPAELKNVADDSANCLRLVDIAMAAQKYGFHTTENWAVDRLKKVVKSAENVDGVVNPWRIFSVASACQSDELRQIMIERIIEQANHRRLAWSWLVTIGEALQITELMGEGYYHIVIRDHTRWNEDGKLTEAQVAKLYIGFCRLVTYKDILFGSPLLPITHHNCLMGPDVCRARWELMWRQAMDLCGLPSVHIIGYLSAVLKYIRHNHTFQGPCRNAWIATLVAKIDELKPSNRLHEFFKPQ